MKTLKGALTIAKTRCSDGRKFISIEVTDKTSSSMILDVEVELSDFADAITGLGYAPCNIEYYDQSNIGKVCEHKIEHIVCVLPIVDKEKRELLIENILKPYEVDGWKANTSNLGNFHNKVGDGYNVSFFRFVDPDLSK